MKLKLDLHDIYNRGQDIDRALQAVIDSGPLAIQVSADGTASTTFTLPALAPAGSYTVSALFTDYTNANGQIWAAGSDLLATKLQ